MHTLTHSHSDGPSPVFSAPSNNLFPFHWPQRSINQQQQHWLEYSNTAWQVDARNVIWEPAQWSSSWKHTQCTRNIFSHYKKRIRCNVYKHTQTDDDDVKYLIFIPPHSRASRSPMPNTLCQTCQNRFYYFLNSNERNEEHRGPTSWFRCRSASHSIWNICWYIQRFAGVRMKKSMAEPIDGRQTYFVTTVFRVSYKRHTVCERHIHSQSHNKFLNINCTVPVISRLIELSHKPAERVVADVLCC